MDLLWLYEIPLWLDMVLFLVVILVPMEIGFRMGLRKHRARLDTERESADFMLTSKLALLGLMLAFTYAFSMSRADKRKQALIHEVNAISTAFQRADLAPEPGRTELRKQLLEYARSRLVTHEMVANREKLRAVIARSLAAQAKLWPATKSAIEKGDMPAPLKASLVQAINQVCDAHTIRMAVIYDRLPGAVLVLLLLIAALSMSQVAYNMSLRGVSSRLRVTTFAVILAALIFLIFDFDVILRGFIQVDYSSLASLIRQMESDFAH